MNSLSVNPTFCFRLLNEKLDFPPCASTVTSPRISRDAGSMTRTSHRSPVGGFWVLTSRLAPGRHPWQVDERGGEVARQVALPTGTAPVVTDPADGGDNDLLVLGQEYISRRRTNDFSSGVDTCSASCRVSDQQAAALVIFFRNTPSCGMKSAEKSLTPSYFSERVGELRCVNTGER